MINSDEDFLDEEDWIFVYDPDKNVWKAIHHEDYDALMSKKNIKEKDIKIIIGSSAETLMTFIYQMDNPPQISIN